MFIAALITIAKVQKQLKYTLKDECIRKKLYIYIYIVHCVYVYIYIFTHTHNGLLFSFKKKKILAFAITWMNLVGIILSEMSDKERQILNVITYIWNLKNRTHRNKGVEWWLLVWGGG